MRKEDLEVRVENNEMRIVGRREQPRERAMSFASDRKETTFRRSPWMRRWIRARWMQSWKKESLSVTLELKEYVKPHTVKIRGE